MPASRARFGVAEVRKFAQKRVDESSLREVADEIGMSFSGLHSFLAGGEPYKPVREKLFAWFTRIEQSASTRPIRPGEIDVAIATLVTHVRMGSDARSRERRLEALIDRLRQEGLTEE